MHKGEGHRIQLSGIQYPCHLAGPRQSRDAFLHGGISMGWRELIVGWLLSSIKVDIDTICKAIEGMDANDDGSLDLGELIRGILKLVKR